MRASRRLHLARALLAALAFTFGCASWYAADADREVGKLLDDYQQRTLAHRASWVMQPQTLAEAPAEPPAESQPMAPQTQPEGELPAAALELNLARSLNQAFTASRDFQDRVEQLYLAGLGFTLTRYNFGPILNSTISYLWSRAQDQAPNDTLNADLGVQQILPTGGVLSGSANLGGTRSNDFALPLDQQDFQYDSSLSLNLQQPLLRGAGYEVAYEALTQGERNLIYAVRDFELFREDFSIRVAEAYYGLVRQKVQLANDEQNYQYAVFDRNKAEALRKVDRNRDEDVFLAKRREIEAENALLVSRTDYKLAVDSFKILLGMPTATPVEIVPDEPVFEAVRIDPDSAVTVALHNRLDLHTQRDQLADSARAVRIARNQLLPDLNLNGNYTLGNRGFPADATPTRDTMAVGATLELPLDRKAERNAYRAAQIALAQARRDLERREDEFERDILSRLRELGQIEKRIALQREQIGFENRAVAVTQIRVEAGDAQQRDLQDARQALTDAQNRLIDLLVQHFIARLRLRRDMGVLFVDEHGMWLP